jgi:eukaryotic translation initiation factor 2C
VQQLDASGKPTGTPRTVKKLSSAGASNLTFTLRDGGTRTVAAYFQQARNRALQFPHILCVEVCARIFSQCVIY